MRRADKAVDGTEKDPLDLGDGPDVRGLVPSRRGRASAIRAKLLDRENAGKVLIINSSLTKPTPFAG